MRLKRAVVATLTLMIVCAGIAWRYAPLGGSAARMMLTLYTTPVIYLYLERLSQWLTGGRHETRQLPPPAAAEQIAAE